MEEELAANRAEWDARVAGRAGPSFSDLDAFKAGRPRLEPFEVDELGALDGLDVVDLQCHVGLDTLDLARLHPTVQVTGVDFSEEAIEVARQLAGEVRLSDRATFVQADVYHAAEALPGHRFDVVYTGPDSLNWLPDLDRWATVVEELLRPGGVVYLADRHPVASVLGPDAPVPALDYFATGPRPGVGGGYEWTHPVSRIVSALVRAGLVLEFFHEWPDTSRRELPYLVRDRDGRFRWPGPGTLPLMYSLRARRPAR